MTRTAVLAVYLYAFLSLGIFLFPASSRADDKLLEQTVGFAGEVLFLQTRVPALVIGLDRTRNAHASHQGSGY